MEAAYPGKRIVHPLELAAALVFLVSDESSFVYGTPRSWWTAGSRRRSIEPSREEEK
jgi:hypothetical protein